MIGTVLSGRYLIEEIVGTGGMAVVYRAWDKKKKCVVAIKVLRAEYQEDAEFLRRFSREAEAASQVSHDNIVSMYDVGQDGDTRYLVMEYVDGTTLKDMIKQMGRLGPDAVVRMGIRILAAVDHAHKNGIVHRDIKPQNILVDSQGIVKVADFGIARMKARQTTRMPDANSSSALGSVHYISPEQASGEVADEKSDLYSVGVVLYEMLTGHVPFDGDTAVSVALKHVSEEPLSMRSEDANISRALDEVVLHALSKSPEDRYQTAAEMAADLRRALNKPEGGFIKIPRREHSHASQQRQRTKPVKKEPDHRQRRMSLKRRLTYSFMGVLIACVLFMVLIGMWLLTHERMPDVLGMTADQAFALIPNTGELKIKYEYHNLVPAGSVIAQYPKEGEYLTGDTDVLLTISDGPSEITISDYTGWQYDEAMRGLIDEGMETVDVEYVLSELPIGTVVSQEPVAGTVRRGTVTVLKVSGETVLAPMVTGYSLENACQMIENEGLAVGVISEAYSADAAAGTVIAQSVAPNSTALKGSSIDLTIAQSQQIMHYPASEFRVVVPLDNTHVRIEVNSPAGVFIPAYDGILNMGTHGIPLSSSEGGVHRVSVYMDDVLIEEVQLTFE